MDNALVSKQRAERCITHSHACDCREYEHAQEIERLRAENDLWKSQVHDEMAANLAFRAAGGALQDEDMPTFCARIIAERDALRARAERAEARIADAPVAVVEEAMWFKDDGESVVGQVDLPAGLIGKRVALVVVE